MRVVAIVLVVFAIILPTAQHASAFVPSGDHVSVRHAPRMPAPSARPIAVGSDLLPVLILAPGPSIASPVDARAPMVPLAAPFVPPRG